MAKGGRFRHGGFPVGCAEVGMWLYAWIGWVEKVVEVAVGQ